LKKLDKYEVLGELGHGAMGVVYRARDPIINRPVALKTITTGVADDPELLKRFYREAQSAGGLQHPNIVTIYAMGEAGGLPYIAMELVEGENLDQVIARGSPLPLTLKLAYGVQACRALDYAHKRGIVHRDIKPGNVMVSKGGTVKVVDFGIARVLETSRTMTGMLIGTFAYMSPEQYHGEHADERSDIWSLGVLMYELLTYQRPFTAPTAASVMHNICSEDPAPLSNLLPECPKELEAVVSKMLRKSPGDRYQSMEDVLLDLDHVCKTLQSQSIADLLDQSRQQFDQGRFAEARDLVRQVLQLEAGNQQARALLEKTNAELKRILNRPKAQQYVEKGQALLGEGKLQEAKVAAENALLLDSSFAPAEDLQRAVLKELERVQLLAGWLESARQHLAEGLLDEAESLLAKVLEAEPSNPQAQYVQQQVLRGKAEREKGRRLHKGLQRSHELWTLQSYDECLKLLQDLEHEFPEEEEVSRLLETVREDQLGQQKRQSLLQGRNLLASGRHEDAIALLSDLQRQFPNDEEIPELVEEVRKDQMNQRRLLETARKEQAEQRKREGLARARDLLGARHYKESIALLAKLQTEFAGESAIAKLLESARKEQAKQQQREGLAQARSLLAERRYDESIILLGKLQADFPSGPEITKLLAAAREELAEQQKQQKLVEARSLFAAQSFAEALALLDVLAHDHPKDSAVTKLRVLVQREQDKHLNAEKVQRELDALKKLMGEKKYLEVIARTNELLAEFPSEPNFTRLAEFAMSRQAIIEKELLFKQKFEEAKAFFDGGRYKEAMGVVQNALKTFPANVELQNLYQQSETQQKKRQVRQKIERRIREIKVKINREELSDAVALAKQTLVSLGPNTDVTQLLNSAQVELQAREKKRLQEESLETIRTLIESGDLDGASRKIDDALKSQTLDSLDPRMQRLSERIKEAKTTKIASSGEPLSAPPPIAPDLSKEYALLQASPLPEAAAPQEKTRPIDSLTAIAPFSAGTSLVPATPTESPSLSPSPETDVPFLPDTATAEAKPDGASISAPTSEMHIEQSPSPAMFPLEVETRPASHAVSVPRWHKPATQVIAALALVAAVWVGLRWRTYRVDRLEKRQRQALVAADKRTKAKDLEGALRELQQAPTIDSPLTAQIQAKIHQIELSRNEALQRQALDAADKLIAKNDLDGAWQKLEQAQGEPLSEEIHEKMQQLNESKNDANLQRLRQGEAVLWQQAISRVDEGRYKEAEKYLQQILALPSGGVRRTDAQRYLDRTIPQHKQNNKLLAEAKQSLARGDIRAASDFAEQLQQNGGDATSVIAEIDRARSAEQVRADQAKQAQLKQLENQFDQLRQRDDESAIQQLMALQPGFQTLAADGGPRSSEALSYVDNIPGAIAEVRDRMDKKRLDAKRKQTDAEFRQMEQSYRQAAAANDKNGLAAARDYFQTVVQESRPHADSAQQYLAEIEKKLDALNQPPPRPPNEVATPRESPLNPAAADEAAVRSTVQRFFEAFQQRNVDGLKQVWPGLPRAKYSKYQDSFQHMSAIAIQIVSENVKVSPDGTTATVLVQSHMQETPTGGKTQSFAPPWTFQLAKTNGTWLIRDVL
jgi:tetratricopeptide (TPR) repeat protein/ferritin